MTYNESYWPLDDRPGRGGRNRQRGRRRNGRGGRGDWPGAGGRGGRQGRGPGRGRRGDVRNAILALLNDSPMNGYQLIGAIADKTDGLWTPGPGSVYPALGLLADEGLISTTEVGGSKTHELTDAGRSYVARHAGELNALWERIAGPHRGFLYVQPEVEQLSLALQQVVLTGDEVQMAAAREILDTARKAIYRLLADDTPAS